MDEEPRRLRFSLKALLGAVVVGAMTVAALSHASPTWASVFLTSTVVVLLMGTSDRMGTIAGRW